VVHQSLAFFGEVSSAIVSSIRGDVGIEPVLPLAAHVLCIEARDF
jgi:hypothetical protein